MGILKLMDFIKAKFPQAIIYKSASEYQDKVLALDASNWIYQFLIKTQSKIFIIGSSQRKQFEYAN